MTMFFWEIVAWAINEASTWSSILLNLILVLLFILSLSLIVGDKKSFNRAALAVPLAGMVIFGFYLGYNSNFLLISDPTLLKEIRGNALYHNVIAVTNREYQLFKPMVLTVKKSSGKTETIHVDSSGFGFGKISFSPPLVANNNWDNHIRFEEDEDQAATDARRAAIGKKIVKTTPLEDVDNLPYPYQALSYEPILLQVIIDKPFSKPAEIATQSGTLSIPMDVSVEISPSVSSFIPFK